MAMRNSADSGVTRESLEYLILEALRGLDRGDGVETAILDGDTPLFGSEGVLDSLGLVSLIVAVEQGIEDRFGMGVTLADEKALSQRHSPYRTVRTLADYAGRALQNEP